MNLSQLKLLSLNLKPVVVLITMFFSSTTTYAEDIFDATLEIRSHLFFPEHLVIPEDIKVRLTVVNHDNTPEEFESYSLNREKIVPANSRTIIYLGPLKAGEYDFFGEFHPTTAVGTIVVTQSASGKEIQ